MWSPCLSKTSPKLLQVTFTMGLTSDVLEPKPREPGGVWPCVDMHGASQAITRERHLMPTLEPRLAPIEA